MIENDKIDIFKNGICVKTFLNVWENFGETFTNPYIIKDVDYWNKYWENNKEYKIHSQKDIYIAMRNIHVAVKGGDYERKYISSDPCKFLQGNMIHRGLSCEFDTYWRYGEYNWEDSENENRLRDDIYC